MKMRTYKFIGTGLLAIALSTQVQAQQKSYTDLLKEEPEWVKKTFRKLSKKQKVAQMFFVAAYSNKSDRFTDSIAKVVKKEKIGGLVFFQGGPERQSILMNQYKAKAKTPLLIASDGEWGVGMRLDSTISYPYQMALGAMQNNDLIYKMGLDVAKDYKRLGMHMNLAPVVDINNNAKNPVINYRSFGENKYNVAIKSAAYMKGMQDAGLLVSIKHFPGHGDTDVDSHYDLPQLTFDKNRLDSLELYPFRELINQGANGVMIAHMNIPSLDPTPNIPSTLSKPIVTDLLRNELGFQGLVISDAMGMKGVVKHYRDGEADVMGIIAGNDVLELSEDSKRAVKLVLKAVKEKRLDMAQIDQSVKRILTAKYWANAHLDKEVPLENIHADVYRAESQALIQQMADASMTLLKGRDYISSLNPTNRTVLVDIGVAEESTFQTEMAQLYGNNIKLRLDKNASPEAIQQVLAQIKPGDQIFVGIYDTRTRPNNNLALSADVKQFISNMVNQGAAFALFCNPYNIPLMTGVENAKALLVAYQKEAFMQKSAAAVYKKALVTTGKLPVTISPFFKYGDGE
ncbi:MAG: glycoside hydrolase family 3 [Pedobacter sp.]|nr:MAG: glycoside hydrolase family 3 [Pedobacter sp.]